MSILTNKMKNARSDHYGANCKLWLPCNEIAGNSLTDRVGGLAFPGSGAADYATAHGVNFLSTANSALAALAGISIPKQGVLMMVQKVSTSYGLTGVTLGIAPTGPSINIDGTGAIIVIPGATSAAAAVSGTAAATNILCAVSAWDTTNLYSYEGINAAAALVTTTALAANMKAALAANTKLTGNFTINNTLQSIVYGVVLFDFSNSGLPTDLLAGINDMRANWVQGRKQLYAGWKDRT
jgi:hypothetical protein